MPWSKNGALGHVLHNNLHMHFMTHTFSLSPPVMVSGGGGGRIPNTTIYGHFKVTNIEFHRITTISPHKET